MSYDHESDPQDARQEQGPDPTEAYQATTEWDAVPEPESAQQGAGPWDGPEHEAWERDAEYGESDDQAVDGEWDDERDRAPGGVTVAKQTISGAADKITRWFAGLDKRPEYEDQIRGTDPVAELEPGPAPAEASSGLFARESPESREPRERGASSAGRRAGAGRTAAAANRRRSVASAREGGQGGAAFSRGAAHAARALRGGERDGRRRPVAARAAGEQLGGQLDEPLPELMGGDGSARFPVAPLGYNRQAVDEQFAQHERELMQLREELSHESPREAPMSIQEELERIGEETASILVVAHDKAHETTRMAQEQAERCISDAAANAVSITEEAKRKLAELAAETDGVRRRRERLIADARNVSASLASLADEAEQRFTADAQPAEPAVEAQTVSK